jgi:hypothetical protein
MLGDISYEQLVRCFTALGMNEEEARFAADQCLSESGVMSLPVYRAVSQAYKFGWQDAQKPVAEMVDTLRQLGVDEGKINEALFGS